MIEEAGIDAHDAEKVGFLEFEFENSTELLEVHVFRASQFTGVPTERWNGEKNSIFQWLISLSLWYLFCLGYLYSDEMRPQWFDADSIPFDHMWADDRFCIDTIKSPVKA